MTGSRWFGRRAYMVAWRATNVERIAQSAARSRERNLAQMLANPGDARHGTNTGYGYGCRCDSCRRARIKSQLKHGKPKQGLPPGDPRHGTKNGYSNCGCRCALCTAAFRLEGEDRARANRLAVARNRKSVDTAAQHGSLWTTAELDYLYRHPHVSAPVLAKELGRSVAAVRTARVRLRTDPWRSVVQR